MIGSGELYLDTSHCVAIPSSGGDSAGGGRFSFKSMTSGAAGGGSSRGQGDASRSLGAKPGKSSKGVHPFFKAHASVVRSAAAAAKSRASDNVVEPTPECVGAIAARVGTLCVLAYRGAARVVYQGQPRSRQTVQRAAGSAEGGAARQERVLHRECWYGQVVPPEAGESQQLGLGW